MDMIVENLVVGVCGADPRLGSEWYELLGRSAPNPDDAEWTDLVERISQVAGDSGLETDGLMEALVAQQDVIELRTAVAAVVWPETADEHPEAEAHAPSAELVEDEGAWNAYLATNGPSWDGTDENWAAFVEWFVYHADEQGVGTLARMFCDYAAANGAQGVFAQYGITLAGTESAAAEPEEAGQAEAEPEEAEQAAAEQAAPMSVEEAVSTYGAQLIAEFRAANPQFADMTDDEVEGVLTEALNGQAAMAASTVE